MEADGGGGSAKRTPVRPTGVERPPPWPSGWFETFKARYPRKEAWGRAEKVLERIRKAGKVPFKEILAGVDRLIAEHRLRKFTPLPATWLNDRGWENESPPPEADPPRPGRFDRATTGAESAVAGFGEVFRRRGSPPIINGDWS